MARDTIPISAPVVAQLAAHGIDVARVAARAGIDDVARRDVTTAEYFAYWRALEGETDRADLGLVVGAQSPVHAYSIASVAALQAPTLGEALRVLARYKRLTCPEHILVDVDEDAGEASVRCDWLLATESVPPLLVDGVFASINALARRGTGGAVAPIRVELARRARHAPILRAHFGCAVRFGAPVDRLVFAARAMTAPFVTASAEAFARIVPGLEAQLVSRARTKTPIDDVRIAIARTISRGARPSIEVIARALRTSARTLQRRLGAADTTFQHQLDHVRRLSARRLLAHTELDPIDISFLLGFAEPNSFARAFRTWERTSPLRWRAARS
ncbi:MAG: AraC family transcriptional regulator [Deltaproteobacteria bacterium]|nr:AraC family transcriptional regulator [Deltaproteobacteria bacterium]